MKILCTCLSGKTLCDCKEYESISSDATNIFMTNECIETVKILDEFYKGIQDLQSENERLKAEMEWISVEDRLPDPLVYVIAVRGDVVTICDKNFIQVFNYTHWMPIPELPQPPKQ